MRQNRSNPRLSEPETTLLARLNPYVALEQRADGNLLAAFDGRALALGKFSAGAAKRAADLRTGLPLEASGSCGAGDDPEVDEIMRRLAWCGLLEYRLTRARSGEDLAIIEPQVRDYAPKIPTFDASEALALSRFAFMRRRGADMVLESPRAGALFRLCDKTLATALASLSEPCAPRRLQDERDIPVELLAMLLDCQILFAPGLDREKGLRASEGDSALILWDFHELLFHARSTVGRHANPSGGVLAYAHLMDPPPAARPPWPGKAIELPASSQLPSPFTALLRRRHSTRNFDDAHPITLAELARFLEATARIESRERLGGDDDDEPAMEIAARPYPSGGASYELELYLAVDTCEGLARGFYHYDAARHALSPIEAPAQQLEAMLADARRFMGAPASPQVLVTMAARFGRVSWKYSAIAYSLVLKHVGVLMQSFYLMATEMELGACAIGVADIDLFAKMTGLPFHVEGAVGQVAIGRGAPLGAD